MPTTNPTLKHDRGRLTLWNVRIGHLFRNNMDYGWRSRIRSLLKKNPKLSFGEIAERLNGKKDVLKPPGADTWTAELVRRAYVRGFLEEREHATDRRRWPGRSRLERIGAWLGALRYSLGARPG
jgi:hypothetical protein